MQGRGAPQNLDNFVVAAKFCKLACGILRGKLWALQAFIKHSLATHPASLMCA